MHTLRSEAGSLDLIVDVTTSPSTHATEILSANPCSATIFTTSSNNASVATHPAFAATLIPLLASAGRAGPRASRKEGS